MRKSVLFLSLVAVAILAINLANAPSTSGDAVNTPVVIFNGTWWSVPHVYQGLNISSGVNLTKWPKYYSPLNASEYWSQGHIKRNEPVLELTNGNYTAGAVFWRGNYSGSGYIEISILATYTTGSPSGGFEFYLFLEPKTWSVYDKCNYSIPFKVSRYYHPYPPAVVILPRGIVKHFIVVQWVSSCYGGKGQWSVLVENGTTASRWLYVGSGCVEPHPGDYLNLTVSYNATANELNGTIVDLSTRANSSLFTLKLGGNYTAPVRGNYTFGVGAFTLAPGANWGVTEVAMVGVEGVNTTQPPSTPSTTTITVTKTVATTTTRTTTMTSTTTSTTTTTIPIPITTTTTSTMTIASTVTVTMTVPKPVLNIPLTTALVVIIIVLAVVAVVGYRRRYYADVATI